MKRKTLITALALIIGLQFTNAQKIINADQSENKLAQQNSTFNSGSLSEWEIVTYEGSQNDLVAIQFTDDNHGWAVGSYGTIINTKDGGLSWAEHNFGPLIDLSDVCFLDESTGFVVGVKHVGPHIYGIAYKTVDGGENWNLSFLSNSPMVLNSIAFADTQNGFLTGYSYGPGGTNGLSVKTTDGGLNWVSVSAYNVIAEIDNIMFNNKGDSKGMIIGWATGRMSVGPNEASVILKSVDMGENWITVYTSSKEINFNHIDFFNYGNGIAVGDNGTILFTIDAGNSWKSQKSYSNNYNATLAGAGNNTWVVGDGGLILNSTENGQNWMQQNAFLKNNLNAICSTPGGNLWVVGDEGTLLRKPGSDSEKNYDLGNSSINGALKDSQISIQTKNSAGPLVSHKNYPNPFQSKTTISFEIDKRTHVILEIYNLNGKLIATLKDQILDSGYYEANFYANELPPGIYTYKLRAGNQVKNGKMIK